MNNINAKSGHTESFSESSLDQCEDYYKYECNVVKLHRKDIKTKSNIFAMMHQCKLWDKSSIHKTIYHKSERISSSIIVNSIYARRINGHNYEVIDKTRRGLY